MRYAKRWIPPGLMAMFIAGRSAEESSQGQALFRNGSLAMVAVVATAMAPPLWADFKGHHTPGFWGMYSGTQAPAPGTSIVTPIYSRYYSDKLVDNDGNEINLTGQSRDITVNSFALFGWWVSEHKLLGANWGMQGSIYTSDNTLEFAHMEFDSGYGFGDVYLQPLNLGWHLPRADFIVSYGLYMPTGKYTPGGDDNSGLGMWTHEFGAGTTLYLDAEKAWSLAAMAYYEIHSEKEGSDTRVGDILTIEGGMGRSWYEGAVSVGLAYYAQWKLTSDRIDGLDEIAPRLPSSLTPDRSRLFGAGPEVNFPIMIDGKPLCLVTARYQWEFGARSTFEGELFSLFFNFPLGG